MDESDQYYIDIISNSSLSQSTKNEYINCLRYFIKEQNYKYRISDMIKNPDNIHQIISKKTTANTVCLSKSCIAIFKYSDLKDKHPEYHKQWKDIIYPYLIEHQQKWENNTPSKRTQNCDVTWKDIIDSYNNISINKPYSIEHMTIGLYTIIAPRRQTDYWKLFIVKKKEDKDNLPNDITGYIDLSEKPGILYVTQYKTKRFYNTWQKQLPDSLSKIIHQYIKNNPHLIYLFENKDGKPYKTNRNFAEANNNILKKVTNNKNMSVNIIRHAAATYVHKHPSIQLKDKRQYALDMGHNYLTQSHYTLE